MRKSIFYLVIFSAFLLKAGAQSYNNEWIDYNKTYYKFKVGPFGYDIVGAPVKKGAVRINQPALAAAGLGNIPAEQFQLMRDGEEVSLFVSNGTGILGASDYIEFWGEIANGKTDKALYRDASAQQLSDYWNLETDSAAYFLTVNATGVNKRFVQTTNDIFSVSIAPEQNFMFTAGRYYRAYINGGYAYYLEQTLYSSSYDTGEGFSSREVHNNTSYLGNTELPQGFPRLYLDTSGPAMTAKFNMVGNAPEERSVKILLNNDSLTQVRMDFFQSKKLNVHNIPANAIKNDTASFRLQNLSIVPEDEFRVASIELQYPRKFNFGATTAFEFIIAASDSGRYLKIANFNRGLSNAVLYDLTNGKRYTADLTITDTLQFLLEPSAKPYQLALVKADGSAAKTIGTFQQTQMVNYGEAANQGNYLIISNPVIYGSGNSNYVQQYSDYRSSDTGGKFNTKIVDIHQLEDQFAFGITMHPLAIKKFLSYARSHFTEKPSYVFLIGKAVSYTAYRYSATDPFTAKINLVPVFGSPGSDNLLSSDNYDPVPATPIGRLSAVSSAEVGAYLEKIKEYESAQRNTSQTLANKEWMKKVLQLAGANDPQIGYLIDSAMARYSDIIRDTSFGGTVINYSKTGDPGAYPSAVLNFTNEYNKGSAIVEYFGHSSSSTIDFSLDNPANYTNGGKYPMFIVNGCLAGNIFDYDVNRLNSKLTLSEKFVLEPGHGAIGYLSSSSFGVLNYLDIFTQEFYRSIATTQYGKGFGNVTKEAIEKAFVLSDSNFYSRMHAEQYTLHGDPALVMNSFALPDYLIDSLEIKVSPGYLTVANDSFSVKVPIHNIGRATGDSVHFSLLRKFPDGNTTIAYEGKLTAVNSKDSVIVKLPIVGNRDKGTTVITAIIDDNSSIAELSKENNTASVAVNISAADLLPVSPYNYAIVNTDLVDLSASTAYAFDSVTQYVMELDTTTLFNSPFKTIMQQVAPGGLIQFKNVSLQLNNTVYYWRVSEDSAEKHWNIFSFTHRNPGNSGFEQAHFYQHTQSVLNDLIPDSAAQNFKFGNTYSNLFIQHSIYPTSGTEDDQFSITINGIVVSWSACVGSSIIFNIFDPVTFKPILNTTFPYNAGATCDSMRRYNFEYSTQSTATRKNAMDFLDYYVQNGYYVIARKIYDQGNADWAPTVWARDTLTYGHNNSLYHRLKAQGTQIDSFTYPRTFVFAFKKNDSVSYKPVSVLSKGLYDRISLSQNIAVSDTAGTATSPAFGPGKSWNKVTWAGSADNNNNVVSMDVIAVNKNGKDSVCYTIDTSQHELNISAINAADYPFVKLRMHTQDSLTQKPYRLKDWSVEFEPVPEGALASNLGISIPDTLLFAHENNVAYDTLKGYIVFKNISASAFDPLKVNLVLYDANNNPHSFLLPRTKPLASGDTVHISFKVNVTELPAGTYNLYLDVNPDNDQPEQYHFNNFLYHYVVIERDPLLPVRLFDFTAKAVNKNVQLQWNVTSEINTSNYSVEFSANGTSFNAIANIHATATNTPVKKYSFVHTSPVNGKNFYRIKMVDKDGSFVYSPIRIVSFSNIEVQVYPNPTKGLLNIILNSGNLGTIKLFVMDATGRQLQQQTFTGNTTLDISRLSAGMYIIHINDGVQVRSFRVYKQ